MPMTQKIDASGEIVTWSLTSTTNVDKLREALTEIEGANGKVRDFSRFTPKTNTCLKALHAALMKVFRRSTLIRPLKKGGRGYSIVREETNKTSAVTGNAATLLHNTIFEVRLPDAHSKVPDFLEIEEDGLPSELEAQIRAEFIRQLAVVPHSNLASSLTRIVDHLHGISIRPSGGVYWMPEPVKVYFDNIANAVMECGPGCEVHCAETVVGPKLTSMVVDNLVRTLRDEMERVADELDANSMLPEDDQWGERKLKTMLDRAKHLDKRIRGYQKMMGVNLQELKDQLSELDTSVSSALTDVIAAKDKKR